MSLAFRASYAFYCIAIEIVVWTMLVPVTLGRILIRRATWKELRQRLGWDRSAMPDGLLIHAVSAGEMRAASALVAGACRPRALMLTTGTHAGMTVAEELRAEHGRVKATVFLPWDRFAVRPWLRSVDAAAVIVTESELWPNLFLACRALRTPLLVVNGRLRPREARRFQLAPWFFRPMLACATWIGTQEADGLEAFVAIGANRERVDVAGNLKTGVPPARRPLPAAIAEQFANCRILLAGSTHDPEESWLLGQIDPLRTRYGLRLVIAPRDVGRAPAIGRMVADHHLRCVTWSALRAAAPRAALPWDVLVIDEFGWLPSLYAHAGIVFLGGTIAAVGGHNIVEPALVERPVIVGPHVESIAALVAQMKNAGALVQLAAEPAGNGLVEVCARLLDEPARAAAMGRAAREICERGSGTVERYDRAIAEQLA